MYRWTPRDTCYHFAPVGHLYRGCERADRMVIDRIARQPVWRRYPLAIFKRTKYSYSFESRRYYWPTLPASCFTEARFSAIHSVRLIKSMCLRKTEKTKSTYDYSEIRFPKTSKSFKKNSKHGKLKLLDTVSACISFFFLCIWCND